MSKVHDFKQVIERERRELRRTERRIHELEMKKKNLITQIEEMESRLHEHTRA